MANTKETLIRINSRIETHQHKYIKAYAKKQKPVVTEGQALRSILNKFIAKNKIK